MMDRAQIKVTHSGQALSPEVQMWRAVIIRAAADHGARVSNNGSHHSRYTKPFDFCAWLKTRDAAFVAEQAGLCIRLLRRYGPRAVEPGNLLAFSRWLLPRGAPRYDEQISSASHESDCKP